MSSIQYSLPIATNKITDSIDTACSLILERMKTFKTSTEELMDYHVEPIYMSTTNEQKYKVSFNYINGIRVMGTLGSNGSTPITGDMIDGVVLANGKLYSSAGFPYVIQPPRNNNDYFKMSSNNNLIILYIILDFMESEISNYTVKEFIYNHTTGAIKAGSTDIPNKLYKSVYIPHLGINHVNYVAANDAYLISGIPETVSDEQKCYLVSSR